MATKPCLQVLTVNQERSGPTTALYLALHHYDSLRDEIDRKERGFREFDAAWADGKVCLHLEDVRELILLTPQYAQERDAWEMAGGGTPD